MKEREQLRMNVTSRPPPKFLYRTMHWFAFGWQLKGVEWSKKPDGRYWIVTTWERKSRYMAFEVRDHGRTRIKRFAAYKRFGFLDSFRVLWFWWRGFRTARMDSRSSAEPLAEITASMKEQDDAG